MPMMSASIQLHGPFDFNIETNGPYNTAYSTICTQDVDLVAATTCSEAPTLVTESIDESVFTGVQGNFENVVQGGYMTSGRVVSGDVELFALAGGTTKTQETNIISSIADDAWNYNTAVKSGSISLSIESQTITDGALAGSSALLLETGPVTNQNFAGGAAPSSTPKLYIGSGDYSTLFPTANTALNLQTDSTSTSFPLDYAGFGNLDTSTF